MSRNDAIEIKLEAADNAFQMFTMSKNQKLLLTVIENLFLACNAAMSKALHSVISSDKKFKDKIKKLETIHNPKHLNTITELHTIISEHKKSPMVFKRKEQLVICDNEYNKIILNEKNVKEKITKAKVFIKSLAPT